MKPVLQTHPLVVATVTQESDLDFLQSGKTFETDILEFRLDQLIDRKGKAIEVMNEAHLPTLATVRARVEGGSGNLAVEERLSLYFEALPFSDLIDVEVTSLRGGHFQEVMSDAGSAGVQRIGSFHDFSTFPGIDLLREMIDEAFSLDCDIAKLAVFLENRSDLFELAELVAETRSSGRSISAMGMGPLGKLSRLVLPEAGSCLNYGFLQVPNAPGQWPAAELRSILTKLGE